MNLQFISEWEETKPRWLKVGCFKGEVTREQLIKGEGVKGGGRTMKERSWK